MLQANRLGTHLAATGVKISHIFSSDLTRAFKTAEAIRMAQHKPMDEHAPFAHETRQLAILREQDFGSMEGKTFSERIQASKNSDKELHHNGLKKDSNFKDVETQEAMRARSNIFIDEYLLDLLRSVPEEYAVVLVAHGIILAQLWRCVLRRFPPQRVSVAAGVVAADQGLILEHLGGWSNTGYLEVDIKSRIGENIRTICATTKPPESTPLTDDNKVETETCERKLTDVSLVVRAVNSLEHLKGLKKTRGGIGSSKHDEGQKTIESFFKRRKIG